MVAVIDDGLRPPVPSDPAAGAYKEWLHLNVIDHERGYVGLVNVSLHGDPSDPRSNAVGAALLHVPGAGWTGNVAVSSLGEARLGLSSIALPEVAIAVEPQSGRVLASAVMPQHRFSLELEAETRSRPYAFSAPASFGSGWISWYVVPRLSVRGQVQFDAEVIRFDGACGYHDHNWGRWHWGDDARWEWGAFLARDGESSFVFSRPTTRARKELSPALLIADTKAGRRFFSDAAVQITYDGVLRAPLRRVPGALAALHQDRIRPLLPRSVVIRAAGGADSLIVTLDVDHAAQLIAGDPAVPGYGFIHELTGPFTVTGTIGGAAVDAAGAAMFEYL